MKLLLGVLIAVILLLPGCASAPSANSPQPSPSLTPSPSPSPTKEPLSMPWVEYELGLNREAVNNYGNSYARQLELTNIFNKSAGVETSYITNLANAQEHIKTAESLAKIGVQQRQAAAAEVMSALVILKSLASNLDSAIAGGTESTHLNVYISFKGDVANTINRLTLVSQRLE